ncbi:MAG TPA: DUF397 domain-containing protein [Streptosporangiaceae bacterium]|jgi:hypothetical protein
MHDLDLSRAQWRKSSYSGNNGNCVEVATNLPDLVAIRDSKNSDGSRLLMSAASWRVFVRDLKAG